MARILLIDPASPMGACHGEAFQPNVGLAYLQAALRQYGHTTRILDCANQRIPTRDVLGVVRAWQPEIVGFSVKTATEEESRRLGREIRQVLPSCRLIMGGVGSPIFLDSTEDLYPFHGVFAGEGEKAFPPLCDDLARGQVPTGCPSFYTEPTPIRQQVFARIPAEWLDRLPHPDFTGFPEGIEEALRTRYPLVTSRGCVYRCAYCSVPHLSGGRLRKRSVFQLLAELEERRAAGLQSFIIIDDLFNLDMARTKAFCKALIAKGWNLSWSCPNGLRADRIDDEMATLMRRSGCTQVSIGVESGDPEVFARIGKGETLADVERGIRCCQRAGIEVTGFFMLGLPGDSPQAQDASVAFARRLGIKFVLSLFVPYPATPLWDWAQTHARFLAPLRGSLHFARFGDANFQSAIETPDFPAELRRETFFRVNVLMRNFGMLFPRRATLLRKGLLTIKALLRYDPPGLLELPWHIFQVLRERFRQLAQGSNRGKGPRP